MDIFVRNGAARLHTYIPPASKFEFLIKIADFDGFTAIAAPVEVVGGARR